MTTETAVTGDPEDAEMTFAEIAEEMCHRGHPMTVNMAYKTHLTAIRKLRGLLTDDDGEPNL